MNLLSSFFVCARIAQGSAVFFVFCCYKQDYQFRPYPTSGTFIFFAFVVLFFCFFLFCFVFGCVAAQLLDIIRCQCVYDTPEHLMNGLNTVISRVKKGDTCLKRVLRVKNLFVEHKKEAQMMLRKKSVKREIKNDDWLYQYADIKLNILMDYNAMSMIVEVQFLLTFLNEAKKYSHPLYSITRRENFVNDLTNILTIGKTKQEQLYFLIHSANDSPVSMNGLAQFLMNYVNEVDLGKLDEKGMNVWHYVAIIGNVKMLRLLLSSTTMEERKKYLSLPAQHKYTQATCLDLAIDKQQIEMVKELRRVYKLLSKEDDRFEGMYRSSMALAIDCNYYNVVKALFDETEDNTSVINCQWKQYTIIDGIVSATLRAEIDYDPKDALNNANFEFFKRLIECKGINGTKTATQCISKGRFEYFDYMLTRSNLFNPAIKIANIWLTLSRNPNTRAVSLLLNTRQKGFVFDEINDDETYYEIMQGFASAMDSNWKEFKDMKQTDAYKCWEILLHHEKIQHVLSLKNKAKRLIDFMVRGTDCAAQLELFIQFARKYNWDLDMSPKAIGNNGKSIGYPLKSACRKIKCFKLLLENYDLFKFDLNERYNHLETLLLIIATQGNDDETFEMFKLLLNFANDAGKDKEQEKESKENKEAEMGVELEKSKEKRHRVDLRVQNGDGLGLIELLYKYDNERFIDYLKAETQKEENYSWDMSENEIIKKQKTYKIIDELICAADEADYDKVKQILKTCENDNDIRIEDIINSTGIKKGDTAIGALIASNKDYDGDKPSECEQFKVFESLLSQKGIIVDEDAYISCCRSHKHEYLEYLIEKFPNSNPSPTIIEFAINQCDVKLVKITWRLKRQKKWKIDIYSLLSACAQGQTQAQAKGDVDKEVNLENNDNFQIFKFLCNSEEAKRNIDSISEYNGLENILVQLLAFKKFDYVLYLIEHENLHVGKKIDFSKLCEKLLLWQVDKSIWQFLLNSKQIMQHLDVNHVDGDHGNTVLMQMAISPHKYDNQKPLLCDHFACFSMLANCNGVNFSVVNKYGLDIVDILIMYKKLKYLDHLCEKFSSKCDILTKESIDKRKSNYKIAEKLVIAAMKSDITTLKEILTLNKDTMKEYINLCAHSKWYSNSGTYIAPVISVCAETMYGYDATSPENVGSNFECFKLLISQSGIDVNIGCWTWSDSQWNGYMGYTTLQLLAQRGKYYYIEYLVSTGDSSGLVIKDVINGYGKNCLQEILSANNLMEKNLLKTFNTVLRLYDSTVNIKNDKNKNKNVTFDINYFCAKDIIKRRSSRTLFGEFVESNVGYDANSPFNCVRFEMLKILLSQKNINSNCFGDDTFFLMTKKEKYEYMEYIICNSNEYKSMFGNTKNNYNYSIGDITKIRNENDENLLHFAMVSYGVSFEIFTKLIHLNIFKDIRSYTGGGNKNTLINACVDEFRVATETAAIFDMLLNEYNADPYIKNIHGYNCFDLVEQHVAIKALVSEKIKQWKEKNQSKKI